MYDDEFNLPLTVERRRCPNTMEWRLKLGEEILAMIWADSSAKPGEAVNTLLARMSISHSRRILADEEIDEIAARDFTR